MKGRRHCGSTKDIKMVCPNCNKNFFFPIGSYPKDMLQALKDHGPVRISCPWECYYQGSTYSVEIDLDNPKEWYGDPNHTQLKNVHDVLYFGEDNELYHETQDLLKKAFPTAVLSDGSDDIHGKRLVVNIEGAHRDDYFVWMVTEGLASLSLTISLIVLDKHGILVETRDKQTILKAIESLKKD
jgi:hypothetical protein